MTGIDIPVEDIGVTIHQPRLKEISILGQDKYLIALQLFSFSPKSFKQMTQTVSTWDILQEVLKQKIDGVKDVRQLLLNFLQLFFIEKVQFGPRSLLLSAGPENIKSIEPDKIDILQTIIQDVGGYFLIQGSKEEVFNPANDKAARIAEKMKKAREKLAKVKAAEMGGDKTNNNIFTTMIATIATKTANSLEDINSMTLFQLNKLYRSYLNWESFDLEIKSRLAGAKNEKNLVHWSQMDEQESSIGTI